MPTVNVGLITIFALEKNDRVLGYVYEAQHIAAQGLEL